jgi:hypothetical protein
VSQKQKERMKEEKEKKEKEKERRYTCRSAALVATSQFQ